MKKSLITFYIWVFFLGGNIGCAIGNLVLFTEEPSLKLFLFAIMHTIIAMWLSTSYSSIRNDITKK